MGGVIGLSLVGEPVLPLSSVVPWPLVEPELEPVRFASEVPAAIDDENGATECDEVGESLMLNRALLSVVEIVDGADLRFMKEVPGALYECACGSTAVCGGGELRAFRPWRLKPCELLSRDLLEPERLSLERLYGIEDTAASAVCG